MIDAKAGTALIMNHDLLHCGEPVSHGEKIILRTDIMCRRIRGSMGSRAMEKYQNDPRYKKAEELYYESVRLQSEGKVRESTRAYLKAMETQSTLPSVDTRAQERWHAFTTDRLWGRHDKMPSLIMRYLTPFEVARSCALTSVGWAEASEDAKTWQFFTHIRFPDAVERKGFAAKYAKPGVLTNWKLTYERQVKAQRWHAVCIDIGSALTKVSRVGADGYWRKSRSFEERFWRDNLASTTCLRFPSLVRRVRGHYWSAGSGLNNSMVGLELFSKRGYWTNHLTGEEDRPFVSTGDGTATHVDTRVINTILGFVATYLNQKTTSARDSYYSCLSEDPVVLAEP